MGRGDTFGERLRRLRERAGLTQEALGERAGLSGKGVAALERGERRHPYPSTVLALAEVLGLSDSDRAAFIAAVPRRDRSPGPESQGGRSPSLPVPPTPLLGRERETRDVVDLLSGGEVRLVTLTGPGGVGKTRLATEVAVLIAPDFPDDAVFVALAAIGDSRLIFDTIGRALGLREAAGQGMRQALDAYLRRKRLLLVLDNFEHLLEGAAGIAGLLSSCPGVKLLATSRAPLRVRGEREYPVQPLDLPGTVHSPVPEDLMGITSVRLFVERARASSPSFELTRSNAAAISAICRRLDGLPLAIELAAPKVRALSPAALLTRLDQSLPLLTGGARDLPDRQRTMRAAIEWSYQLLEEPEWRLLNRLSVFRGGWELEAAEAVGAGEDVLDILSSLVEQSLVVAEPREDGTTRYRMLVPVREYAEERLVQSGEAEETRLRHAEYYLALAERAGPELRGARQVEWLEQLELEHDNLRGALDWLSRQSRWAEIARFGWALWLFWWLHGHFSEGRRYMDPAFTQSGHLASDSPARLLCITGGLAMGQGDLERAVPIMEESIRLSREVGDELGLGLGLGIYGLIAIFSRQFDEASALLEECAAVHHRLGDKWGESLSLTWGAAVPIHSGDSALATEMAEKGLALARESGDRLGLYAALYTLASLAQARGELDPAVELFEEALLLSIQTGDRGNVAYCLEGLAAISARRSDAYRAARIWGAAEALLEVVEAGPYAHRPERLVYERAVSAARAGVSDLVEWNSAWAKGRAMMPEQAVEYALDRAHKSGEALTTKGAGIDPRCGEQSRRI